MAGGTSSADCQACFLGVARPVGIASICVNDPYLANHRPKCDTMSTEESAYDKIKGQIVAKYKGVVMSSNQVTLTSHK